MPDCWYGTVPYGVRTAGMEDDRWAHIGGVGSWLLWSPGCGLVVVEGMEVGNGGVRERRESDRERGRGARPGWLDEPVTLR